jgi:hypothetical protein
MVSSMSEGNTPISIVTGYVMGDRYSIPGRGKDIFLESEVLTSVTVKNNIFWDVTPCTL